MNSYSTNCTPVTAKLVVFYGLLAGSSLPGYSFVPLTEKPQGLYRQFYETRSTSSSCGRIGSYTSESCSEDVDFQFVNAITGLYAWLVEEEKSLGQEFTQVLHDNLWELYEG